jgi:hypothetical protein
LLDNLKIRNKGAISSWYLKKQNSTAALVIVLMAVLAVVTLRYLSIKIERSLVSSIKLLINYK